MTEPSPPPPPSPGDRPPGWQPQPHQPQPHQPYPQHPYGQQPYGQQPYPHASPVQGPDRGQAVAALVLAAIPLVLTWIPAVVLAIITLTRPRDGRDHGKPLAVAALAVVAAWIAVAAGILIVVGVSAQDDSGSSRGIEVAPAELQVGDCVPDETEESDGLESVSVVPCAEPHAQEVYAELELEAGDFPGDDEVAATSEELCIEEFEDFVGLSFDESILEMYYLYPIEESWSFDRGVTCLVRDGTDSTGSLAGVER